MRAALRAGRTVGTPQLNGSNYTKVFALNQFYGAESSSLPTFATPNKVGIPRQWQFSIDFEF
jgi:hypothetical protein